MAAPPVRAMCDTDSPPRRRPRRSRWRACLPMLLIHDVRSATALPRRGNVRVRRRVVRRPARPVGRQARPRVLRLSAGRSETHRPRLARCRACRVTHVLVSTRSFPRRPDPVEVVGAALLAAASGAGHRRVAAQVDRPATTVRGWLRRARANNDVVRSDDTVATYRLDTMASRLDPTGSALGGHARRCRPGDSRRDPVVRAGTLAVAGGRRDLRRRGPRPGPSTALGTEPADPSACFDVPGRNPAPLSLSTNTPFSCRGDGDASATAELHRPYRGVAAERAARCWC